MANTTEVLEPIVNQEPKEQEVTPFNKKDIQKLAREEIFKLTDELVNKAIDEGKIDITDNIRAIVDPALAGKANVYETEDDIDNLDSDFVAQLKCGDFIVYNNDDDEKYLSYVGYDNTSSTKIIYFINEGSLDYRTYHFINDEWTYNAEESGTIEWSSLGGTKLYKHSIAYDSDDNGHIDGRFIVITKKSTPYTSLSIPENDFVSFVKGSVLSDSQDEYMWYCLNFYNNIFLKPQLGKVETLSDGSPYVNFIDTVTEL